MEAATHLLSELTHQVGIVVTPAVGETALKAIGFVPLSGRRVLCVVVSANGFVDNKVIETEEDLSREELERIGNYLTESFAGLTLREIRTRLLKLMAEDRAQMDRLLARSIELAHSGLDRDSQGQELLLDGTRQVLNQPELADIGRVRRLFEAFADKARLVALLNQCLRGSGVRVLIGEDSALTGELDFSLVAAPYGPDDRPLGGLGILGPSRMEYERVVPLVHYLGERLSRALAETFAGDERN
jgi:heat-inducible transcriptional repressor